MSSGLPTRSGSSLIELILHEHWQTWSSADFICVSILLLTNRYIQNTSPSVFGLCLASKKLSSC